MQTHASKFRRKYYPLLYRAIFEGRLPETAVDWPLLEIKQIPGCIGSGESTQFGASVIARLNGKRIAYCKRTTANNEISHESLSLPGKPILIGAIRGGQLFAIEPTNGERVSQ